MWPYLLVAFLYFATWPFHHGLNNPNEMVRVYMTRALVDTGSPVIDEVVHDWGGVDDKALRDGHLYSSKAPFQSLLGVPVYAAMKKLGMLPKLDKRQRTQALRWFASALPGLALAWLLLARAQRRAPELLRWGDALRAGEVSGSGDASGGGGTSRASDVSGASDLSQGEGASSGAGASGARDVSRGVDVSRGAGEPTGPGASHDGDTSSGAGASGVRDVSRGLGEPGGPDASIDRPASVGGADGARARRAGTAIGIALALGTMLYPYALTFTGHILAALSAGGAYLAVVELSRSAPGSRRARVLALLAGLGGGAAPFAEYPAALMAGPALLAGLAAVPGWTRKMETAVLMGLGGLAPFAVGLWAHWHSWGSPFKTGYSFLENRAYVEVHGSGFFGVGAPKLEAFGGALFSPGTGLFFFSPVLAVGLLALLARVFARRPHPAALPRSVAIGGLIGVALEVLFISGHNGWRGGWTVGPRYIIPVAPVLGVWVVEALGSRWLRKLVAPLGMASVIATGFAAALYPHLSDVFTNPLVSFLWPSYLRGEISYGIGHTLGLTRTAANLVHVVPLAFAAIYVGWSADVDRWSLARSAAFCAMFFFGIALIPERDASAAQHENQRLWGFWEPPNPSPPPPSDAQRPTPPGLIFRARDQWLSAWVQAIDTSGKQRPCMADTSGAQRCQYGPEPWQHYGPETLDMAGKKEPVLFMHPIRDEVVRATFPLPGNAKRGVLRYGLADASVSSANPTPVDVLVVTGGRVVAQASAGNAVGLHELPFAITSTAGSVAIELRCAVDGARVFGFDLELYDH